MSAPIVKANKETSFISRYGSDVTRAVLRCDGSSGVIYESIQPKSLEKIKHLELGSYIQDIMESFTLFFL